MRKWAGIISISNVLIVISSVIFNMVYIKIFPFRSTSGISAIESGLDYYAGHPVIGFDHGIKGLVFLASIMIPIGLFWLLYKHKYPLDLNIMASVSGVLSFLVLSVSFILQGTLAEYSIHLYNSSANGDFAKHFAVYLFDWGVQQGGLSVSLYIVSNILAAIWILIHSMALKRAFNQKLILYVGLIYACLGLLAQLISFFYLMQGIQNIHNIDELVGFIEDLWLILIGILLLKRPQIVDQK